VIDNQEQLQNKEISVVLNRCRDKKAAAELTRLVYRHAGIANVMCLPDDPIALEKCELKNEFLAKQNPKHEIAQQICALVKALSDKGQVDLAQIQNNRLQQIAAAA
jgi:MinD-like ATPase involved in chromosome partitioning or flagellar assembly